jgi:hypothetical protein
MKTRMGQVTKGTNTHPSLRLDYLTFRLWFIGTEATSGRSRAASAKTHRRGCPIGSTVETMKR